MKNLEIFKTNKLIRNNATRVLISAGIPIRQALIDLKEKIPYLFASKTRIKKVEDSFLNF